ncbi:unnamed protein product [Fusarium graminearum]|nr:unnamed protein product [Fusarium graminearum]VTO88705.1 unnamed protein product [Fusarium graminearum]
MYECLSLARVSEVLSNKHSTLLTNEQSSRVRVAAHVVGADGQISNLESFDAVDVESLVEDTVLNDAVALLGSHGAGSKGVPGRLGVALDPFCEQLVTATQ